MYLAQYRVRLSLNGGAVMKTLIKVGALSIVFGIIVGAVLYNFAMDTHSIMGFIVSCSVSSLLGYMIVSSIVMTDDNSSGFKENTNKFFERKDNINTTNL